jgi:hypothetical protein
MQGAADLLEQNEDSPFHYDLTDYKTWGSYKIMKTLGFYTEDVQIVDSDGNPVRFKSGKRKGQIKTRKETKQDESKIDLFNEELQLNMYRIMFEEKGFPISRMQIQALVRDGNTVSARSRGVTKPMYIFPIKKLPDDYVKEFYANLQTEVDKAFEIGYAPKCNAEQSWEGRRCKGYCEVATACSAISPVKRFFHFF